ncbi:hypothetical protein CCY99_08205 [Helicobacter sp. 16-1353]|uniref:hypothetical protein n=1 Tax=Helicobacter sp. 16-1353 TaxID=2004996 RepID=UPI000DCDCFF5|nr:hypothetical protein [Helicobacter sp. 16-1353]RAX51924.1 hypothetical protein CCY99_08205 [Helicobacter sp. 16-1353]
MKIYNVYKKLKNREFKLLIRGIALRIIPAWLDKMLPIPQNYSFFLISTHGSGFHSLLYYIALCSTPPHHK